MEFDENGNWILPREYIARASGNGISPKLLRARLDMGWDIELAMTTPPGARKAISTQWDELAKANGIHRDTYTSRIRRGWDPERAATTTAANGVEKVIAMRDARRLYDDEIYKLLDKNGISRFTFHTRIKKAGWDVYRAATEPVWTHEQVSKAGRAKRTDNNYVYARR